MHDLAVDIRQTEISARVAVGERFVIEAEDVQDGGVEVMHVNGILDNVRTPLIRLAMGITTLDTGAGE